MLGISSEPYMYEEQPLLDGLNSRCAKEAPLDLGPWDLDFKSLDRKALLFSATACETAGPRVLFFRDSFTTLMKTFLGEHFSYATYVYGTPKINKYEHFFSEAKPDFVVEQIIERYLSSADPAPGSHY